MKSGTSHQWKSYSKCQAFSSTKSENQSTTCATRISDSATKCNFENIPKEKIQTRTNATEAIEKTIESLSSTSPFTEEESCIQDFRSDNNDDLKYPQIERKNIEITENQREKEKCCIERKDSNSSSDYEKMDIVDCKASIFDGTTKIDPAMPNTTILEPLTHIYKIEKNIPVASKIAAKSRSVNDLAIRETTYENPLEYLKQDAESATSDENDDSSSRYKKKKRRFTRNVLHYVPRHLVKQPKKKKSKKKYVLSSSLSSLQMTPFSKTRDTCARTRSLSREELKGVIISSPTNFVHVASATNPSLVRDTVGSGCLEQVVITHQQICATLPLLVGKDERRKSANAENASRSKVAAGMSPDVISKQSKEDQSAVESVAGTRRNQISLSSSIMVKEFMQMLCLAQVRPDLRELRIPSNTYIYNVELRN